MENGEILSDLFLDITFPEGLCGFEVTAMEFFTVVQRGKNGAESRLILNKKGRVKYILESSIISAEKMEEVLTFFKIVKGRGHSFRFKDTNDFRASGEGLMFDENGSITLCKTYSYGALEFKKIITKPKKGTVRLKDGEFFLRENVDYKIDYNTGNLSLMPKTKDIPLNLKASFEYDLEARFETDELMVKRDSLGNIFLPSLIITEIVS